MKLEDFQTYNLAMKLGERVYLEILNWDDFNKETIGKQLIRSVDSIAANLSEGMGRFYFKERKNFTYYSRGSLFETKTWLTKASNRNLITEETYKKYLNDIDIIGVKINNYINSINNSLK